MNGDQLVAEIVPFRKSFARAVRKVAEKSWFYTYRDIYSHSEISNYMNSYYDLKNLSVLEKYVQDGTISFNVARVKGRIVGFCQFGKREEFELLRIYILPEWIGKGIGRQLLEEGENWVRACNGSEYVTNVQKRNRIGTKFYEKSGLSREPSQDRDDDLCYRKVLA